MFAFGAVGNVRQLRSLLSPPILAALVFGFCATHAGAAEYSYRHFKEVRPLTLDETQVAVFDTQEGAASVVADLARAAGFSAAEVRQHPIRGWSLFQLSEASASPTLTSSLGNTLGADRASEAIERLVEYDSARRFFFAPVFVGELGEVIPTQSILVKFRDDATSRQVSDVLSEIGLSSLPREEFGGFERGFKISVLALRSGAMALEKANQLADHPLVIAAGPDMMFPVVPAYFPNDQFIGRSWGLYNYGQFGGTPDMDVDATEAWDRNQGNPLVVTAVLDTGVQQDHPDLNLLTPGVDVTGGGTDGGPVNQCDNHGTPVAGVIASVIDNGLGTAGVAPRTRVLSIRAMESIVKPDGSCGDAITFCSWSVEALNRASQYGATITNNSNWYGWTCDLLEEKYQDTKDLGMVHFASAGNWSENQIWYPARLPTVIAVTGITRTGARWVDSNWGPEDEFTASSYEIFTTDRTGSSGWVSGDYIVNAEGTSFSSPMVAGIAALLLAEAFSLDPVEVQTILRETVTDLGAAGWDSYFGWGFPNAASALKALDLLEDDFESGSLSLWNDVTP